jgi:hypothetical protein
MEERVLCQIYHLAFPVAVHITGRNTGTAMTGQSLVFTRSADYNVGLLDPQLLAVVVIGS